MTITDELLAWSGWRWLVGMVEANGGLVRAVVNSIPHASAWHEWDTSHIEPLPEARPDLGHAGTLGLIEHVLLRDAWGPTATLEVKIWPGGDASISVLTGGYVVHAGMRAPLATALVRACIAAPDRGDR